MRYGRFYRIRSSLGIRANLSKDTSFHIFYLLMGWWIHVILTNRYTWSSPPSDSIGLDRPENLFNPLIICCCLHLSAPIQMVGSCSCFSPIPTCQLDPSLACITNMDDRLSLPCFPLRLSQRQPPGKRSLSQTPNVTWKISSLHNHFHPKSYS